MRQLLTESCVLAGGAGLAGLLLASLLVQESSRCHPQTSPHRRRADRHDRPRVRARALAGVDGALRARARPACLATRSVERVEAGRLEGNGVGAGARLRSVLVVAEVALSVILLATAGLLVRSFLALQQVDLGFTTDCVLVACTEYAVGTTSPRTSRTRSRFYAEPLDRLRNVPWGQRCVRRGLPGDGASESLATSMFKAGQRGDRASRKRIPRTITDYFKTLEIPVRAGRFRPDRHTGAAAGRHRQRDPGTHRLSEVASDSVFRQDKSCGGLDGDRRGGWRHSLAGPKSTRAGGDLHRIDAGRRQLAVHPGSNLIGQPVARQPLRAPARRESHGAGQFETMDELFDSALAYPRFRTQVIGLFGECGVVLAAVGIFSVLAYWWGQRTRELAIRRALGARTVDVIPLIIGQGLRLVAIGPCSGTGGCAPPWRG